MISLKGHTGIAKFLLNQPKVNINGRNDIGRTIIMTMMVEALESSDHLENHHNENKSCPLSEDLLSEITDLIEKRNADVNIYDRFKRNLLHYLAGWEIVFINSLDNTAKTEKVHYLTTKSKMQLKFMETFLKHNCDPWLGKI